ncbi:MAG: hypothetical protein ACK5WF_24405, partial [Cyclobacteriaceae bacterium]
MKPSEKGWLKAYLDFRQDLLRNLSNDTKKTSHPEQSLYRVIQPTGLMYGQAIDSLQHPDSIHWSERDKMKILLAESLISSSLLFVDKKINTSEELSEIIEKTLESIGNFYN